MPPDLAESEAKVDEDPKARSALKLTSESPVTVSVPVDEDPKARSALKPELGAIRKS